MSSRIKCAMGWCKWPHDVTVARTRSRAKWFIRLPDGSLRPLCAVHGANEKLRVKLTDGYREWCVQEAMSS